MGIEDENKLKTSRRIASVWVVISMFIAIFIGIIGNAMTKAGAMDVLENSSQSETLIVRTAVLLSNHGFLAVLMAGLILAGILQAPCPPPIPSCWQHLPVFQKICCRTASESNVQKNSPC